MKQFFQKILAWITDWPKDKVLHFAACLIIALLAGCTAKLFGAGWQGVMCAAWFAGFIAGVVKEIYDDISSNGSEEADWAADIIGTTMGTIIVTILTL